jgi:hypothetical protein
MFDLGMVYLQGLKDIGLARDPARARALFGQAFGGGGEVLYRYTGPDGHGWIVTAQQVRRVLERIQISSLNSEPPPRSPERAAESARRHPFTLGAGMKQRPNHWLNRPCHGLRPRHSDLLKR